MQQHFLLERTLKQIEGLAADERCPGAYVRPEDVAGHACVECALRREVYYFQDQLAAGYAWKTVEEANRKE